MANPSGAKLNNFRSYCEKTECFKDANTPHPWFWDQHRYNNLIQDLETYTGNYELQREAYRIAKDKLDRITPTADYDPTGRKNGVNVVYAAREYLYAILYHSRPVKYRIDSVG